MTKNQPPQITRRLAGIGNGLVIIILVLLPFHAFLTTWLGSKLGALDVVRTWKEALLLVGGLLALAVIASDTSRRWRSLLRNGPFLWTVGFGCVVLAGVLLTLASGKVTTEAMLYGTMIHLRLVASLCLAAIFALYDDTLWRHWRRVLFWPAAVVVTFGLLQVFVLPLDFLTHFGYGPDTIPAFQTVDNKLEFQRIQSTLRGANPFGAYLVVVTTGLLVHLRKARRDYRALALLAGSCMALFFTYSRSALIGLGLSVAVLLVVYGRRYLTRRTLLIGAAVMALLLAGVWWQRDNDFLQNTVFHSDETSVSAESSNEKRGEALSTSFGSVVDEPWGGGIGSAGPASVRNDLASPRIAENHYLQTAQELGWIGLVVLLGLLVTVGRYLWRVRADDLALLLVASLVGLSFINLVSHAWADDTLMILWWVLCGVVVGRGILNEERTK